MIHQTLTTQFSISGIGIHSGIKATLAIPSTKGTIRFNHLPSKLSIPVSPGSAAENHLRSTQLTAEGIPYILRNMC